MTEADQAQLSEDDVKKSLEHYLVAHFGRAAMMDAGALRGHVDALQELFGQPAFA